jgi:hypothetical protein
MSVNGMNVGRDYQLLYYDATAGLIQDLGDIQNVRITAQKHDVVSRPYNQPPRFGYVPDGYRIDFTITRTGSELEDLMVLYETNFNGGRNSAGGYLNETVNNPDGSVSRYQYQDFVIFMTDQADVSRERVISQRMEGMASTKIQLA